jgi:small subunit ribosomal protein S2
MSKYRLPKAEELLDAGVHFGHQVRRWHPKMEPYIYSVKKNIHIIDLEQTEKMLKEACEFLYETAKKGEQIVFVGTKMQAREVVELEAKRSGALYVTERWIGGTITNFKVIKKNIDKLLNLTRRREEGDLEQYTKKERLLIDREIEKLYRDIGGIVSMRGVPGALVVVDARREKTAIREAKRSGVPVVALIDTNSDPTEIDHVVPGNDDAIKAIAIVLKSFAEAVEEGYKDFAKSEKAKLEVKAEEQNGKDGPAAVVSADEAPRVIEEGPEAVIEPEEVAADDTKEKEEVKEETETKKDEVTKVKKNNSKEK